MTTPKYSKDNIFAWTKGHTVNVQGWDAHKYPPFQSIVQ